MHTSKLNSIAWFDDLRKLHSDHYFLMLPYDLCDPYHDDDDDDVFGAYVLERNGSNAPMWLLADMEVVVMLRLRGDRLLLCKPFDFVRNLCIDMYDWEWETVPEVALEGGWNLWNIGYGLNQSEEDSGWIYDVETSEEVLENYLKIWKI